MHYDSLAQESGESGNIHFQQRERFDTGGVH